MIAKIFIFENRDMLFNKLGFIVVLFLHIFVFSKSFENDIYLCKNKTSNLHYICRSIKDPVEKANWLFLIYIEADSSLYSE
jgi:hypothetical protein